MPSLEVNVAKLHHKGCGEKSEKLGPFLQSATAGSYFLFLCFQDRFHKTLKLSTVKDSINKVKEKCQHIWQTEGSH